MDIVKLAVIAIVGVLLTGLLKNVKQEYSMFIAITTAVLLFFFVIAKLEIIFDAFERIQSYISISETYLKTIVKMLGIAYVAELTSGICKDSGYQAIAGQVELFGKIAMIAVSMPVVLSLIETIETYI